MIINYLSEYGRAYSIGLRNCHSLEQLREFTEFWHDLAPDAYAAVWGYPDKPPLKARDFADFQRGLRLETKGQFAGDRWAERYSMIVMPEIIFRTSLVAEQFQVPWGTAFIRLEESGFIQKKGDVYSWNPNVSTGTS